MTPNNRLTMTTLAVVLLVSNLTAQSPRSAIYSTPDLPAEEALRRLNLNLAWRNFVPMDGKRDGLLHVEVLEKDLFVLTKSGLVTRLDAETGRVYWRSRVGKPYTLLPVMAANSRSVYVGANAIIHSLDRATGSEKWDYPLPAGISAPPIVDEEQIYIPGSTSRFYAFYLPFVNVSSDVAVPTGGRARESLIYERTALDQRVRPRPVWSDLTNLQLSFKPLQTPNELMLISPDGRGLGFSKLVREEDASQELYHFTLDGKITVAPEAYGDTAYIGSDDAALYALNMRTGKLRWRHTAGTAISRKPVALEKDVFVTSAREGMARIDRATGEAKWKVPYNGALFESNPEIDRFLAANDKFIYANDGSGRLLVVDRKRGIRLSMLDTTAYRYPIVNEITDRLYLAANDGMIVCLHDRDLKEPLRHRKALEDANSPVVRRLAQLVNEGGGKDVPLREALNGLRSKYNLHTVIAAQAFRNAKVDDPSERIVKLPTTDNKPLRDHLQRILNQVNSTFQVVDQTVLIIPKTGADKEKKDEKKEDDEPVEPKVEPKKEKPKKDDKKPKKDEKKDDKKDDDMEG